MTCGCSNLFPSQGGPMRPHRVSYRTSGTLTRMLLSGITVEYFEPRLRTKRAGLPGICGGYEDMGKWESSTLNSECAGVC